MTTGNFRDNTDRARFTRAGFGKPREQGEDPSDIALLRSSAAAQSFEQQLAALQRRHTLQGNEGERVAGFQSRRMAGRTVGAGVEREEAAAPSPKAGGAGVARKAMQEPRAPGAPASVASASSPPPPPSPAPSLSKDSVAEPLKARREVTESKKAAAVRSVDKGVAPEMEQKAEPEEALAPAPARRWGRFVKGQPHFQASTMPAPLAASLPSLESCLQSDPGLRSLGLGKVPVLLRVEKGRVARAVLGQGLPAPACLVVDVAVAGEPDGWLVIEAYCL